jgi:hypothetical protein
MEKWKIENRIEDIIENNCIEHRWEGTEVYKQNIKDEVMSLIDEVKRELLKDFVFDQFFFGGDTDSFVQKFIDKNEKGSKENI